MAFGSPTGAGKLLATIPLLGVAAWIYTVELAKGKFGVRRHIM